MSRRGKPRWETRSPVRTVVPDLLARGRKRGIIPMDFANVAQSVEQRFRKPQVVGSNPTVGSSFFD